MEVIEAEEGYETTDYYFERIGEPIRCFKGETLRPASGALAVCSRRGLVLAALGGEVCVTGKGGNVIASTQVDGDVRILSVSPDHSTLAAATAGVVHFLRVEDLAPSFTRSVPDGDLKDLVWSGPHEYLLLSRSGTLYRGEASLMDGVAALSLSPSGAHLALATADHHLAIHSSKTFTRASSFLLSFHSDSDVQVDALKWVRPDSIVVGCLQLTPDGREESYFVQVIRTTQGNFSDPSTEPIAVSFYDLFSCVIDDILPFRTGPYLLLAYLHHFEIAITANKKNTDGHVVLLGWSLGEEKNHVATIDIQRDKWLPRIELQENGDDNLILGLCVDKVSCDGKFRVEVGNEEWRELSPRYVLICLTLEGKLVMFNVASVNTTEVSPTAPALSDEEEDAGGLVPVEFELSKSSIGLGKEQIDKCSLDLPLQDMKRKELDKEGNNELAIKTSLKPAEVNKSPISVFPANESSSKVSTIGKPSMDSSVNSESSIVDGGQEVLLPKLSPQMNVGSIKTEQTPIKASFLEQPHESGRDIITTGTQVFAGFGSGAFSLGRKVPADSVGQLNRNTGHELGKISPVHFGSTSFLRASSQEALSDRQFISSKVIEAKSPLISTSDNIRPNTTSGVSNLAGDLVPVKETVGTSPPQSSARLLQSWGQRPPVGSGSNNIDSLPSIRSSHVTSQDIGILSDSKHHPSKENYRTLPQSGMPNSEPNLSKQFGNIKDMTKELDVLLNFIEQPGGFRDACTVAQKNSVEMVEEGIQNLSEKCRMWQNTVDEQLIDVQNLLDKTVQVLATKIYMEGIIKQISDTRYWDLWNRQKLSPELDLKRQQILKLNKDLSDQLIELGRHFNSIEHKKFAENGGVYAGKRSLERRYGASRQIQSFHSLHNTMSSQLAAAEKLSECLSKQMSMLKIESPSLKPRNVKKELLETIGIPYDASFSSPNALKTGDTHFNSKLLFSAGSTAAKEKSKGKSSVLKDYGQETARRRRESLDRSWASYEPPKTTVKRLLLQDSHKPGLSADKKIFSSHLLERSARARSNDSTSSSALPSLENKGLESPTLQRDIMSSATQFVSAEGQKLTRDSVISNTTVGNLSRGKSSFANSDAAAVKENKSFLQSETRIQQKQLLSTPAFVKTPSEELNSRIETALPSSVTDNTKNKPFSMSSLSAFGVKHDSPNLNLTRAPAMLSKSGEFDTNSKPSVSTLPVVKTETQLHPSKSEVDTAKQTPAVLPDLPRVELQTKLTTPEVPIKTSMVSASVSQSVFGSASSPSPNVILKSQAEQSSSAASSLFQTQAPTSESVSNTNEDNMDEEAPESSSATELSLGSVGGFGIGSIPNSAAPKPNPFGSPFGNLATNVSSPPFTMNVPSGQLFRPASFSFQSPQPSQTPPQAASSGAFSAGFGTATIVQAPRIGFGQPAQIGQGQQALGSVLGSFGQSRQLGTGTGFGMPSGFGGGFSAASSGSGFSSAVSGGGFANISPAVGGFGGLAPSSGGFGAAAAASGGGGFAAAASGGGGFGGAASASGGSGFAAAASGGGGFAAAASGGGGFGGAASASGGSGFGSAAAATGGGFGAFGGQGGTGGFSAFGSSNLAATGKPPQLFTEMRK